MGKDILELISGTIDDAVQDFFYSDRDDDQELSTQDIEYAINSGKITIDGLKEAFSSAIDDAIESE